MPGYHRTYEKEHVLQSRLDMQLVRRLLSYLLPFRSWMLLSLIILVAAKTIEASLPLLIGSLADKVIALFGKEEHHFPSFLLSYSFWLLALLAFGYVLDAFNVLIKNWVGQKALLQLRTEVFDRIQHMPVCFFDHQLVGRLMSRTIHDVEQINQFYCESLVPILGAFFLVMGIVAGIFYLNWKVALVIVSVFPFLWWLTYRFRSFQRRCYQLVRSIISAMNNFVQEQLSGAATVWSFGSQARELGHFKEINDDFYTANVESIRNFSFFFAGIDFFHQFVLVMIFASLALLAEQGEAFQAGQFFAFSLYALMIFRPIGELAERYNVLQSAIAASERLFDMLDRTPEKPLSGLALDKIESIVFDKVWFAYEKEHWALCDVSFTIQKGQSIAIVGMTGSGKTTLLSLLLRFYEAGKGQIRINGRDIGDYSLASLRKQFSVVLQDPVLFSTTIKKNIVFGCEGKVDEIANRAVDYVGINSFIERFAEGLEHTISGAGIGFSAGEQQLIALARAVAFDGSAFLLDEATAHIDTESERRIQKTMQKLLKEKTSLVIAHRLSTVQHVDNIFVLHHGRLVESGSHRQLLAQGGIYEQLYKLQFQPLA